MIEQFLDWDDGIDRRHELVDGPIVTMALPSEAHATIVANLGLAIRNQLWPPARLLGRFGVRFTDRDDSFYPFDLAVTCAPAEAGRRYIADPVPLTAIYEASGV